MRARYFLWLPMVLFLAGEVTAQPARRNFPYIELEGEAQDFSFTRNWRSYYWREDFTLLVKDDRGQTHRVISREPTPWNGYRLGTTYTGLKVDWSKKPRVQIIGVKAIDRQPAEYYDLKLDPEKTVTAFILRVQRPAEPGKQPALEDFNVNNWFHDWGAETDRKILAHYANNLPAYTVYGYIGNNSIAAPFDRDSQDLLKKYEKDFQSIIFHGRVKKAKNDAGYELQLLHILGRERKGGEARVFHGNPAEVERLDGRAPGKDGKK